MDLLGQLERLYARQQLPHVEGNPCGSCFACCTARNHFQHRISDLELAYVAWKVDAEAADRLSRYAARERDEQNQLVFERCPHYDGGCTIYPHRPFSCRVFGHYRERGTSLPEGCSFKGREVEFERPDYYAVVPSARELRPLMREFSLLTPSTPGANEQAELSWLNCHDPVDRALGHLARHDYPKALEQLLLELESQPEGSGFVWHTLGLVYGLLERHQLAVQAFRHAVEAMPGHVECLSQLGSSLMLAGHRPEGMAVLARVVEQDPERAVAHGLLGYGHLLGGQPEEAERHLHRALELDPGNPFYVARLNDLQVGKPGSVLETS